MPTNDELKINTIYIISKGRPQCTTAKTLTNMHYKGEWFIVCGNNDDTVEEYKKNWGEDRVIVFDWYEEIKHTDPMDNFGFEKKASGACPVRNATKRISRERGEKRHWQFDDDYNGFYRYNHELNKNVRIRSGKKFFNELYRLAEFGYNANLSNVGFCPSTIEAKQADRKLFAKRVFNAHNLLSDETYIPWVGRMNDDTINALNVWRNGGIEISFKYMQMNMEASQQEKGGLTDLYKQDGTVRKTAYAIMACPGCVKLVNRFGRYHHSVDWESIAPKLISERYKHG